MHRSDSHNAINCSTEQNYYNNSLDSENLQQRKSRLKLKEDIDEIETELEIDDYSESEQDDIDEFFLNTEKVTVCRDNNYYNNNNNHYYQNYNLNYNHLNVHSHSKTQEFIHQLKRRSLREILQRPTLIQIVAFFMWFHGKFWEFYYETLARRLQFLG